MYRSFTIKNFRCFDELTVEGMGRINLIAGKNNVGKTALLEALWVHHGAPNPELGLRVDSFRGFELVEAENPTITLFRSFDQDTTVELSANGDWGKEPRFLRMWFEDPSSFEFPLQNPETTAASQQHNSSIVLRSGKVIVFHYLNEAKVHTTAKGRVTLRQTNPAVHEQGLEMFTQGDQLVRSRPSSVFLTTRRSTLGREDIERFSELEISGNLDGVLQILREIEPRLQRLAIVSAGQAPAIYASVGERRMIPVQLMGDGISRVLNISLAIAGQPGGMVLVDEIENGIHYSVMEKVWRAIGAFARSYDVQLFATTHSL